MFNCHFWIPWAACVLIIGAVTPDAGAQALRVQRTARSWALPRDGATTVWRGTWNSETTGHRGRLAAKISAPVYRADRVVLPARFRGTFAKVIPFWVPMQLEVQGMDAGGWVLGGQKRLGPWGTFEYSGTLSNGRLHARYRTPRDQGVWTLQQQR